MPPFYFMKKRNDEGYRTVGPKQPPEIKKKPTKQDAARLQ